LRGQPPKHSGRGLYNPRVSGRCTLGAFLGRDLMAEQEIGPGRTVWNMVEMAVAC
jgi:hypothetical protein